MWMKPSKPNRVVRFCTCTRYGASQTDYHTRCFVSFDLGNDLRVWVVTGKKVYRLWVCKNQSANGSVDVNKLLGITKQLPSFCVEQSSKMKKFHAYLFITKGNNLLPISKSSRSSALSDFLEIIPIKQWSRTCFYFRYISREIRPLALHLRQTKLV